jgi:hypothetical protein
MQKYLSRALFVIATKIVAGKTEQLRTENDSQWGKRLALTHPHL